MSAHPPEPALDPAVPSAVPPAPSPVVPPIDPAFGGGRSALSPSRLVLAFAAIFLLLVVIGAIAVVLLAPPPTPPHCPDPTQVCSGPPVEVPPLSGFTPIPTPAPPTTGALPTLEPVIGRAAEVIVPPQPPNPDSPPLRTGELVTSTRWAYALEHADYWTMEEAADGVISSGLSFNSVPATVFIRFDAANAAEISPSQMIAQLEAQYAGNIQSLAEDTSDANRILNPKIGFIPAEGRTYRGTLGTEGGVQPVSVVLIAATDGRLTVTLTVLATLPDSTFSDGTRVFRVAGYLIDPILKRFHWVAP